MGKDQHIGIINNLYFIMPRQQIVEEVVVFNTLSKGIGEIQMQHWLRDLRNKSHNVHFV